ncbi:hypothetical protein, partial [Mycobacterium ostraviense]|uniref:hypothetical protein n=1 Tax=Mycobacterium ostraviense TaxID=2738409 RepID=UPI0015D4C423
QYRHPGHGVRQRQQHHGRQGRGAVAAAEHRGQGGDIAAESGGAGGNIATLATVFGSGNSTTGAKAVVLLPLPNTVAR